MHSVISYFIDRRGTTMAVLYNASIALRYNSKVNVYVARKEIRNIYEASVVREFIETACMHSIAWYNITKE